VTGGHAVDRRVDLDPMVDDRGDQFAGQFGRHWIAFRLGQMALEDGLGRALPEVRLEDRGQREATPPRTTSLSAAPSAADPSASALGVSLRHHRR
jgi:hypothetical protein